MTLSVTDSELGSLGSSVFCDSESITVHVKLVSVVLRGEMVREDEEEVDEVTMAVRAPDSMVVPSLSCQVKVYTTVPLSTFGSTPAEHCRTVFPPATKGVPGRGSVTTAGVTALKGNCSESNGDV